MSDIKKGYTFDTKIWVSKKYFDRLQNNQQDESKLPRGDSQFWHQQSAAVEGKQI